MIAGLSVGKRSYQGHVAPFIMLPLAYEILTVFCCHT